MNLLASLGALLGSQPPLETEVAKRLLEEADVSHDELRRSLQAAIKVKRGLAAPGQYCWIRDVYDDRVIFEEETPAGTATYELTYTVDDAGSVTLGETSTKVRPTTTYVPVKESADPERVAESGGAGDPEQLGEAAALEGEVIPLVEKAVRRDGTFKVKLIQPGWGSSGYYSAEVLERDGPKVFPKGTKMYWDHPTATEAKERPERSLKDLAAELVSAPKFEKNGADGPGLYAEAKAFGAYKGSVEELAPHIGTSIRAWGRAKPGVAEGRKGKVIEALTPDPGTSVDFVTQAGAGGKVLQLFEAARGRGHEGTPALEEDSVSEQELKEARDALAEAQRERDAERQEKARLAEALLLREARDVAGDVLGKAEIPDITRARLVEQLAKNPPTKDGALDREAFETRIGEAVKAEAEYLAKVTGSGQIRGMGGTGGGDTSAQVQESEARIGSALGRVFGLSESESKIAAGGRSH